MQQERTLNQGLLSCAEQANSTRPVDYQHSLVYQFKMKGEGEGEREEKREFIGICLNAARKNSEPRSDMLC